MMRILFLAANPVDTHRLDLEDELRAVKLELEAVIHRNTIECKVEHAVQPDDLLRHVRRLRPTVVHFCGHGSRQGIILRNDRGGHQPVPGDALRQFFADRGVDLVVLNACYSEDQASCIAKAVRAVVGTTDAVGDEAARRFASAFYRTLGDGLSIRDAFRDGRDAVALHGLADVFYSAGELDIALVHARSDP
jgi:CHAT domain-containing protein